MTSSLGMPRSVLLYLELGFPQTREVTTHSCKWCLCFDWKHLDLRMCCNILEDLKGINRDGNLVTQSVFNLNAMRTEMFATSSHIII